MQVPMVEKKTRCVCGVWKRPGQALVPYAVERVRRQPHTVGFMHSMSFTSIIQVRNGKDQKEDIVSPFETRICLLQ